VGVAVALVALGGCFGEPGPIVTRDVTSTWTPPAVETPTPSPSPSPTALSDDELLAALPEEAKCSLITCARATAEFMLLEEDRVITSGDLTVWNALSLDSCAYCASVRENTIARTAAGEHVLPSTTQIDGSSWTYSLDSETGDAYASAFLTTPVRIAVDTTGAMVRESEPESGTQSFQLQYVDGVWRIAAASWEPAPS